MSGEIELEETANPNDTHPLLHHNVTASNETDIENDDVEAGSIVTCRICLECDGDEDDDLISPCTCKGTQQFVHRACLDHWRSVKEGFAFSHCTTCKAQFHLQVVELKHNSWRTIKFRLFVARDVFLVFLAVQTVIGLMGGLAYIADKNGSFRTSFDDSLDRTFTILLFYRKGTKSLRGNPNDLTRFDPYFKLSGVLVFFVLVGFIGLILHCLSCNNDPRIAGCQNCCFGLGMLDCFPASVEVCLALVVLFVVIFLILGIAYGFLAGTMVIQRIWQRYYHILTKRELTQEYVVGDLHGRYTPPNLDPAHEERLRMLKLL